MVLPVTEGVFQMKFNLKAKNLSIFVSFLVIILKEVDDISQSHSTNSTNLTIRYLSREAKTGRSHSSMLNTGPVMGDI